MLMNQKLRYLTLHCLIPGPENGECLLMSNSRKKAIKDLVKSQQDDILSKPDKSHSQDGIKK